MAQPPPQIDANMILSSQIPLRAVPAQCALRPSASSPPRPVWVRSVLADALRHSRVDLLSVAQKNLPAEIRRLIAAGVSPSTANGVGQTALHVACLWGNHQSAEVLIQAGALVMRVTKRSAGHFSRYARRTIRAAVFAVRVLCIC